MQLLNWRVAGLGNGARYPDRKERYRHSALVPVAVGCDSCAAAAAIDSTAAWALDEIADAGRIGADLHHRWPGITMAADQHEPGGNLAQLDVDVACCRYLCRRSIARLSRPACAGCTHALDCIHQRRSRLAANDRWP